MLKQMKQTEKRPVTQLNLLLRAVIGGYLLYLAYALRNDFGSIPFTIAIVVFSAAGVVLVANSLKRLYRMDYFIPGAEEEEENLPKIEE